MAQDIFVQTDAETEVETSLVQLKRTNGYFYHQLQPWKGEAGGFLSSLLSKFLSLRQEADEDDVGEDEPDGEPLPRRSRGIQTEMDQEFAKTVQLSYLIIRELGLNQRIPSSLKDGAYRSLGHAITTILERQPLQIHGMVSRIKLMDYRLFPSLADELFELNADNPTGELRISWGRIIALYAFAVRLSQENQNRPERVDLITRLLASYMTSYVLPFIRQNNGWNGLVDIFPPPTDTGMIKNLFLIWSGVCAVAAIFYLRSVLRRR